MSIDLLENEIRELEKETASLPSGSIAKKKKGDKEYCYHRCKVDGKTKDIYIRQEEVENLRKKIEKRRENEKKLKALKAQLPAGPSCLLSTLTGKSLYSFAQSTSKMERRDGIKNILDYIHSDYPGKVFILFGLRRTGKTTLISQTIYEMEEEEREKACYIKINRSNTLHDVNLALKRLQDSGYKYIFIDEVTLLDDFISSSSLFSDIYALSGMKIVLSGTDSLSFMLTEDEELYDRAITLHTTFIPFREFSRVLGIDDVDEYIRYGGTMCTGGTYYNGRTFKDKESTDAYVNQAIAENIQHSLKYYQHGSHFLSLIDLYRNNELTGAINRIVEDINHNFTVEVLTKDFSSNDFAISRNNLEKDRNNPSLILYNVDLPSITEKLMELLKIKNKDKQKTEITEGMVKEIEDYLKMTDLIYYIPVVSSRNINNVSQRIVFTQPGIRYAQAEALIIALLSDNYMRDISLEEREYVKGRILSEINGRMLEDIVLLETSLSLTKKKVFVLKFTAGEFDMVIHDPEKLECEIYEIKHSRERIKEQARHLMDEEKLGITEKLYGRITKRCVLYKGSTVKEGDIDYINVEEYLKSLKGEAMVTL